MSVLQYQCNINVTFPIITLTIYYSILFQFFHLSLSYYLLGFNMCLVPANRGHLKNGPCIR